MAKKGRNISKKSKAKANTDELITNGVRVLTVLSNREHQTLSLIADGYATKHIAERLNISVDTVETHRKNLLRKLEAVNMAEAVATAFRNNLLK